MNEKTLFRKIKLAQKIILSPVLVDELFLHGKNSVLGITVFFEEDQIMSVLPLEREKTGIITTVILKNLDSTDNEKIEDSELKIVLEKRGELTGLVFYNKELVSRILVYAEPSSKIWLRQDPIVSHELLSDKKVVIFGMGSVGSRVALELGRAGVGTLVLVDPDRLEIHNIVRHIAPLKHLGRKKVNAVEEIVRSFNPFAKTIKHDIVLDEKNPEEIEKIVEDADLVVVALGPHEANMLIDNILYPIGIPAIYSGVFRRGYGGTVYTVLPDFSGCYNCAHEAFVDKGILEFYMQKYGVPEFSLRDLADQFVDYGAPNILIAEPAINTDISIIANIQAKVALWLLAGKDVTKMIGQIILIVLNTEQLEQKMEDLNLITTGHMSWTLKQNCPHHQKTFIID